MADFSLQQALAGNNVGLWQGRFKAMASPCEVLIDGGARKEAARITRLVCDEAHRIERHWSRYRDDSIVQRINTACGEPVRVDEETADMLDYAQRICALSEGAFDITSGVLRRAWTFDGSDRLPTQNCVDALMPLIGWHRAVWRRPVLQLPTDMQLDFGGIGKEYAVDCALAKVRVVSQRPVLLNFGGDLVCDRPRVSGAPWQVGIEPASGTARVTEFIAMTKGGVATSGDANRYLEKDGRRYSHVLDARTGWPVEHAPRSVTVAAKSCTLAGMLATLAMLQGPKAKPFLDAQGCRYLLQ